MPVASISSDAVGVSMIGHSQIVKAKARTNFHSLLAVNPTLPCHSVNMDKNGGPNHLRAWREFRGMTLEHLADAVDTTPSMISMLESGDRGLSAKWMRRLAPALDTTPGHLLDHDPITIDSDILEIWMSIGRGDKDQAKRILMTFATGTDGK